MCDLGVKLRGDQIITSILLLSSVITWGCMYPIITRYALLGFLIIMVLAIFYQCSTPGYRGWRYNPVPSSRERRSGGSFRGGGPGGGK